MTLKELVESQGNQFPIKATGDGKIHIDQQIYIIHGITILAAREKYIIETETGEVETFDSGLGKTPIDWQLYQEPKKKKKLYLWAYKSNNGKYYSTTEFHENEADVPKTSSCCVYDNKFIRLDHTMIEVEEE